MILKKWDIFISYATEDKLTIVQPLVEALRKAGIRVWYDEHELRIGDSLSEKIDEGLFRSTYGAVILSPAFFAKHWPKKELSGLRAREEDGEKVILPIWHDVDKRMITEFSPTLADILATNTNEGINNIADKISEVIFSPTSKSPSARNPSVARRLIELLESKPTKTAFIDFVKSHERLIEWYGRGAVRRYSLFDTEFDAYAEYAGHGCQLSLVTFTEAWNDPFVISDQENEQIRVCKEIINAISQVRATQQKFNDDPKAQIDLRDKLTKHLPRRYGYFKPADFGIPRLAFTIYGGRRSFIDSNPISHKIWSVLRNENDDIRISTYDYLIDQFLRQEHR